MWWQGADTFVHLEDIGWWPTDGQFIQTGITKAAHCMHLTQPLDGDICFRSKGSLSIGDRQIPGLIVQCSKLITTFWRRRPDFFVHLGPVSQSDWVGGQQQWQQGRPHQVYQEHVQKCTWHRKKVVSIMVESVKPFSEPQEDGHQDWHADRPQQDCQKYVDKLRVLSHSLITPG